jgi:hypothetical protein
MALRACAVTLTDIRGVRHHATVEAETLFEAAALGLAMLRQDGWVDKPGPGTELEIHVQPPAVRHTVSVGQLQRWLDGATISPNETLKKRRLKELLGG